MKESRLVVLGAGGVGKSSLVLQYLQGTFSSNYSPTVEDCYSHTVQLPNGLYHAMEILDTAGSHHFPAMRELSIRCGKAFVIVFAVNNEQSFYDAQSLCALIKQIKETDNVPMAVVGNKIDLSSERLVSWHSASDYVACNVPNGSYLETSAKYNLSINDVFNELLILAFGIPKHEKLSRPSRLSLSAGDMAFPSYRRKSSSAFSFSSSSAILSASTRSYSDYSFKTLRHSHGSSTSDSAFQIEGSHSVSSPSFARKKSLKKCLSAFVSSTSSHQRKFQRTSSSMFSQSRRRSRISSTIIEQNAEKCVFL